MKRITTTFFALFLTVAFSFGQSQEATTAAGKRVTLNIDGTWKYLEAEVPTPKKGDCSDFVATTVDKMTGKSSTSSTEFLIISKDGGKNGLGIMFYKQEKGGITFAIKAVGGGCIDQGGKINFLFTDGSRLELVHEGKFNCEGNAYMFFGGNSGKIKQLNELQNKKIATIRVSTNRSYVEEDLNEEQGNNAFQTINCLLR